MTCKGTLRQVFIRVYRQSCWYFWPSFVNCCPFNLIFYSTLPPLPCVKYTVYTYTVCKGGEYGGSGPQTDKHLPESPFTGQFFIWWHYALSSMSLIFLRRYSICYWREWVFVYVQYVQIENLFMPIITASAKNMILCVLHSKFFTP